MTRPRDSQRARVYRSEEQIDPGSRLESVPEMQAYVDRILRSRWWKSLDTGLRSVTVKDGRGRRRAGAYADGRASHAVVAMPRWSRTELTLLHELAHCWTSVGYGESVASHGWQFTRNFLSLADHVMGIETGLALREAYRAERVKWHPSQ